MNEPFELVYSSSSMQKLNAMSVNNTAHSSLKKRSIFRWPTVCSKLILLKKRLKEHKTSVQKVDLKFKLVVCSL